MYAPFKNFQNIFYSIEQRTVSMLSFTMKNDGNDRERIMTSLVCTFPESEFTEMDQVLFLYVLQVHLFSLCTVLSS